MIRSREVAVAIGIGFAGVLAALLLWNRRKRNNEVQTASSSVPSKSRNEMGKSQPVESVRKDVPCPSSSERQDAVSVSVCNGVSGTLSTELLGQGRVSTAASMESLFVNPRDSPLQRLSDGSDISDGDILDEALAAEEADQEFPVSAAVGVWLYQPPQGEDDPDRVQLVIPSNVVASFIGRNGRHIKAMEQTGASVKVISKAHRVSRQKEEDSGPASLCNITGRHAAVREVLQDIAKRFPGLGGEPLRWPIDRALACRLAASPPESVSFGRNIERVTVSHVDDPSNLWLQLVDKGELNELERLNDALTCVYSAPQACSENALDKVAPMGAFCAAPLGNVWLRARLLWRGEGRDGEEEARVMFVDFGSSARVPAVRLMQLRAEFFRLPFQALHCRLACISPLQGASEWPALAKTLLKFYIDGASFLTARTVGEESGVLCIELYQGIEPNVLFINRDLVQRRCAQWVEADSDPKQ